MSFIKVYIHLVWSTKHRLPLLHSRGLRNTMWQHIRDNAKTKDIYIDHIGGYNDHCHCLISLRRDQSLQKIVQLIKGESAFWANKTTLFKENFEWQDEYFAVSVSESIVEKVRDYINNQEEYHKSKTFDFECQYFIKKFKMDIEPTTSYS